MFMRSTTFLGLNILPVMVIYSVSTIITYNWGRTTQMPWHVCINKINYDELDLEVQQRD